MQSWTPWSTALRGVKFIREAPVHFSVHLKESHLHLQMAHCLPAFLPSGWSVFISTGVLGKLVPTLRLESWNQLQGAAGNLFRCARDMCFPGCTFMTCQSSPHCYPMGFQRNKIHLSSHSGRPRKGWELWALSLASISPLPANICTIAALIPLSSGSTHCVGCFRGAFLHALHSDGRVCLPTEG